MNEFLIHTYDEDTDTPSRTTERFRAMSLLHCIDQYMARHSQEISDTEESFLQFTVQPNGGIRMLVTISTYPDPDAGGPVLILRIEV